jgi:hypothetical protein
MSVLFVIIYLEKRLFNPRKLAKGHSKRNPFKYCGLFFLSSLGRKQGTTE